MHWDALGMRFVREAFFTRHKHDKQFAAIGEQRRRTEMIVILMEVPGWAAHFVLSILGWVSYDHITKR